MISIIYRIFLEESGLQDVTQRRLTNSSHCVESVAVLRNVDKYLQSTQRKTLEDLIFSRTAVKISNLTLYRAFLGEPAVVRENVPRVKIHRYNKKYSYPKLSSCRNTDARKIRYSCASPYCTSLARFVIHTLRRSVLQPVIHAGRVFCIKCLEP